MTDYEKRYKELVAEQADQRFREELEREREYQQREDARRHREQEAQEALLYADTWPEAFSKSLRRLRKEATEEAAQNAEDPDSKWNTTFFAEQVAEHEFAQEIYREEMAKVQQRIEDIRAQMEKRIAILEQAARNRAARRVDKQFKKATCIGENLRNNDLDAVTNW